MKLGVGFKAEARVSAYFIKLGWRCGCIFVGGVCVRGWVYMFISGVSWGVHSVRLHPGGSKRGAKKEGRKRKKQGKGEEKRERKGAPKKERREGKENMRKKRKSGRKSKEKRI